MEGAGSGPKQTMSEIKYKIIQAGTEASTVLGLKFSLEDRKSADLYSN